MNKKTILLVDDVQLFIEHEKSLFSREDFNLITACNGTEAMKLVFSATPDLVFLDLYMPDMNGDECCRLIKADPRTKKMPVVIVTLSGKEEDLKQCRQAGCDDIIFKPINSEHFIETAKKYLKVRERAHDRHVARLQIHFRKDNGQLMSDYSINLSSGGVYLETMNLMEVNTPLLAEFEIPDCKDNITCKARVAWVNHPNMIKDQNIPVGMGIQFNDLSSEDMDHIRHYIQEESLFPRW